VKYQLIILGVALPIMAAAQSLDIVQDKFTSDVRILTPAEFLSAGTFKTLQRANALPEPVAVGALNGVTYLYRSNGIALFATAPATDWRNMSRTNSWAIGCSKDAMTDVVSCAVSREDLRIVLSDTASFVVLIGTNHYPGSEVAIRFDQERPLHSPAPGFPDFQTKAILDRSLTAATVTTRYQKWPYQANIDRTLELYGFKEALTFLRWAIPHFK
jgi:hypothetical protein